MRIDFLTIAVIRHLRLDKRNFFIGLFLLVLSFNSYGQLQTSGTGSSVSGNTAMAMRNDRFGDITDTRVQTGNTSYTTFMTVSAGGGLKLPAMNNVEGSPFLHTEYQNAYVRIRSGYSANVPVKFNIYGNEIIFVKNGNELALDSVDFVSYLGPKPGGGTELIQLKTGYPSIGKNDRNTIYQILDSGITVQLLKHTSQTLEEVKSLGVTSTKQFSAKEEFYIYTPAGGMKKVKLDKKSVMEALPQYAQNIQAIIDQKNIKLKKEADLVELIRALSPSAKGF